jgi:formate C-acetyltransferase
VVAAYWEFIVPGAGMDIVNINGLSFARAVIAAINRSAEWNTFAMLMKIVREEIATRAKEIMDATADIYMEPSPFLSLMMDGCVERGRDISLGGIYNNYGIHGTGLSTAVDSLAAIRKYIFEDQRISKEELKEASDADERGEPGQIKGRPGTPRKLPESDRAGLGLERLFCGIG